MAKLKLERSRPKKQTEEQKKTAKTAKAVENSKPCHYCGVVGSKKVREHFIEMATMANILSNDFDKVKECKNISGLIDTVKKALNTTQNEYLSCYNCNSAKSNIWKKSEKVKEEKTFLLQVQQKWSSNNDTIKTCWKTSSDAMLGIMGEDTNYLYFYKRFKNFVQNHAQSFE